LERAQLEPLLEKLVNQVKRILLALFCLACLSTVSVGCKKKEDKKISKALILKRLKWAKPGCRMFYNKMVGICGDFLKKKKRTVNKPKFLTQCAKKAVVYPNTMQMRFFCASVVKTCGHLRHCNKCGRPFCKDWKKGPKVAKIEFPPKPRKPVVRKGAGKAPAKRPDARKPDTRKPVVRKPETRKPETRKPVERRAPARRPAKR
jgi:hypothetical protein